MGFVTSDQFNQMIIMTIAKVKTTQKCTTFLWHRLITCDLTLFLNEGLPFLTV